MKYIDKLLSRSGDKVDIDPTKEVVEKRSFNSKTFATDTPGKFRVVMTERPIHFMDKDGVSRDYDLEPVDQGDHWSVTDAPFSLTVPKDKIAAHYVSGNGDTVDIELESVGGKPITVDHITIVDGVITWHDIATDFDISLVIGYRGIEWFKYMKSADAPTTWTWDVKKSANAKVKMKEQPVGWDSGKTEKVLRGRRFADHSASYNVIQDDRNGYHAKMTETFVGRVSYITDRTTRQRDWTTELVYPVIIDADVTEVIAAGGDDAYSIYDVYTQGTYFDTTQTYIEVGHNSFGGFGNIRYYAGMRWQTIPIPQGSIIDAATLVVQVLGINNNSFIRKIYGNDVDDAATWGYPGNLIKNITKTAASVDWAGMVLGNNSIGVTNVVQEIIDRTGWVSNNDMALVILPDNVTIGNKVHIAALEHTTEDPPTLIIDYTNPQLVGVDTASVTVTMNDVITVFPLFTQASFRARKDDGGIGAP